MNNTAVAAAAQPSRLRFRHASGLHAVTRALQALHRELVRSDTEAHAPVRTSVMNLVAACTSSGDGDRAADDLLRIGARHPARAIVLIARPERPPALEADISLHCSAGAAVCTELVRLNVCGEPAYHLTGIVEPLLIPDMPVHLWVVGAPPLRQAFSDDAVALTDSIIIDSGAYDDAAGTLALLADQLGRRGDDLRLADIAWERTKPWREAVAQAFDSAAARPWLRRITSLTVDARRPAASDAWLLAGWMASRLGWEGERAPGIAVRGSDGTAAGDRGVTAVAIAAGAAGKHARVALQRHDDALRCAIDIEGGVSMARTVTLPEHDEATLVSGLMSDGGGDPTYREAVAAAAALAAR